MHCREHRRAKNKIPDCEEAYDVRQQKQGESEHGKRERN